MLLRARQGLRLAVDGPAARDEDDLADPAPHALLEQVDRAEHVHVGVVDRVFDRLAHFGMGRVVVDDLRPRRVENLGQLRTADVRFIEGGRGVDVAAVAGAQDVDDRDLVPGRDQPVDDVRADEAGPAGHDRARAHR